MTFTHADQYPVMTDDSRVSYHEPVYFPFDLRPDNRHRFGIKCQQISEIFFFVSIILGCMVFSFTVVLHDNMTSSDRTPKIIFTMMISLFIYLTFGERISTMPHQVDLSILLIELLHFPSRETDGSRTEQVIQVYRIGRTGYRSDPRFAR